jgi:hypothetical protein
MRIIKSVLIVLLIFLGLVGVSFAIEWHTANQVTVEWNVVTDVVAPDVLKYAVYTKRLPNGEPVLLGEQDTLTAVITFEAEGKYIIGVTTVRYVDVGLVTEERLESEVNWSDVNGENTPNPFGGRFYEPRNPPKNLRYSGTP